MRHLIRDPQPRRDPDVATVNRRKGSTRPLEEFMQVALSEARASADSGNLGVGAIVVADDVIIGRGGNCVTTTGNPLAHAETNALDAAIRHHGREAVEHATLVTTFEPCPMCMGAALVLGIASIVVGGHRDAGDRAWGDYSPAALAAQVATAGPHIRVVTGPLGAACVALRDGRTTIESASDDHAEEQP